jgi:hypothetical protein
MKLNVSSVPLRYKVEDIYPPEGMEYKKFYGSINVVIMKT